MNNWGQINVDLTPFIQCLGSTDDVRHRDASDAEIDHGTSATAIENGANLACWLSENCD